MVDTTPTRRADGLPGLRPELGDGRTWTGVAPGQPRVGPPAFRPRIPSLSALAALVVNGLLRLPANYRRGLFLDILV